MFAFLSLLGNLVLPWVVVILVFGFPIPLKSFLSFISYPSRNHYAQFFSFLFSSVWKLIISKKVKLFASQVLHGRINTMDRIQWFFFFPSLGSQW